MILSLFLFDRSPGSVWSGGCLRTHRSHIVCVVLIVLLALPLCYLPLVHAQVVYPIVDTTLGKVLGKRRGDVNSYLGIPFAEPPIGKLRFRPPHPKRPWYPSVYRALHFGPECLQSELFAGAADEAIRPRDEDCLHINIWQPVHSNNSSELLPVLVWFYGGAFMHGGAARPEYDGHQLAKKGVIVVSFNYRVGAFGFLVSTADGLYGNYGLEDQKFALQWVQDNIRFFGGDANRVTLFGESAGAMSIALHLLDQEHDLQRQYERYSRDILRRRAQMTYDEEDDFWPEDGLRDTDIEMRSEDGNPRSNVKIVQRPSWEEVFNLIHKQQPTNLAAQVDGSNGVEKGTLRSTDSSGRDHQQSDDARRSYRIRRQRQIHRDTTRRRKPNFVPKRLFQAVIMQSNPLGYKYRSITVANFIGRAFKELLDCEDLRCLQTESPEELLHVQDTLMAVPRSIGDFFTWGPVLTDHSFDREIRLASTSNHGGSSALVVVANVTVRQPIETMKALRRLDMPVIMGTNSHEGHVFVFSAFPTRMNKVIYQALVWSFFRSSAPKILQLYRPYADALAVSRLPDYREVLSQIIGDYLFHCPTQYFATQLTGMGTPVYMYKFALKTRTPGFPCCDGLSCHTCEIPYVFHQLDLISADYSHGNSFRPEQRTDQDGDDDVVLMPIREGAADFERFSETGFRQHDITVPGAGVAQEQTSAAFLDLPPHLRRQLVGGSLHHSAELSRNYMKVHESASVTVTEKDASVAALMSAFWTTFARYGNPNGNHDIVLGQFRPESRPEEAPWWPRLLGEATSFEALREAKASEALDDWPQKTSRYSEAQYSPMHMNQRGKEEGRGSFSPEVQVRKGKYQEAPSRPISRLQPTASSTVLPSSALSESGFSVQRFMHQMVFDEETLVYTIENDCVCSTWNMLEYRF